MADAELVRNEILFQCYTVRPGARDATRMARLARHEGDMPDATAGDFDREAAYLVGKGLLEIAREEIARAHIRYRITSAGVDYLEERGLT